MTDLLATSTREFVVAAQQNPLLVRTMIAADPGSEPVCHQVLASFTDNWRVRFDVSRIVAA